MTKKAFQSGFALGLASGGIFNNTGGAATDTWQEDTSEVVAEYKAYQNIYITAYITGNGTLTWKRNSLVSGPNQVPRAVWNTNIQQIYNAIGEKYIHWLNIKQAEVVNIPEASGDKLITELGQSCFNFAYNLERVRLPDTITGVGNSVFYECRSLREINLPDGVTSIGTNCFSGCYKLEEFNIPPLVTSLNANTFTNCTSLKKVSGIEQLTSIDQGCFSGCVQLGDSVTFGENIDSIAYDAFNNCFALKKVFFKGVPTNLNSGAFRGCSEITDIYCPWAEGEVANAPWGATKATIHYNWTEGGSD